MTLSYKIRDNNHNTKKKVIKQHELHSNLIIYNSKLKHKKHTESNLNSRETDSSSPFTTTINHHHYNHQITTKMNSSLFIAFVCLQISLVCFDQVNSLKCYSCSSVTDSKCDESFDVTNRTAIDCADDANIKAANKPAKLCRKIVQHVETRKIVTRSCGWIDHSDNVSSSISSSSSSTEKKDICVKRSGTFAVMMESCTCYSDGCNHSANLVPNNNIIIFTILPTTLLLIASCLFTNFTKSNNKIASLKLY